MSGHWKLTVWVREEKGINELYIYISCVGAGLVVGYFETFKWSIDQRSSCALLSVFGGTHHLMRRQDLLHL